MVSKAARLSAAGFICAAVFQSAIVAGAPLGAYAWGGGHDGVLPARLRVASLVSASVLVVIAVVLVRGWPDTDRRRRLLVGILGFDILTVIANSASRSSGERAVWVPFGLIQVALALLALQSEAPR